MKTLIIGQAPAKDTVGAPAFSGKSGPKFADLLGVEYSRLWNVFDVINLINWYPGSAGKGDLFPEEEARIRADAMRYILGGRRVVMVGLKVATAFGASHHFFDWFVGTADDTAVDERGFYKYCIVPHPSGVSRFYNSSERIEQAKLFMRTIPR